MAQTAEENHFPTGIWPLRPIHHQVVSASTNACALQPLTHNPGFCEGIITVHVGLDTERQFFRAHKSLVSDHSAFFEAAMKQGWKESAEGIVRLPVHSPAAFRMFLAFLYTGHVHSIFTSDSPSDGDNQEWNYLEEAWLLGEHLMSTSFKDAIVDTIVLKLQARTMPRSSMCQPSSRTAPRLQHSGTSLSMLRRIAGAKVTYRVRQG